MYEEIFEYLPDAILIVGRDGHIQQANTRAEQLFGYQRGELPGQLVEVLIPERLGLGHVKNRDNFFHYPHIRPMGTGLDLYGRRKDGSEFPVDITLGPLGKKLEAAVCAVRDMTDQRQLMQALADKNAELHNMTQQLWQTAKLATMGELAAGIAHELNNPLGIISLRIESLLEKATAGEPGYRALEIISQEVDRMTSLVANLLQSSRKQTRQVSTMDICEELNHTIELMHYHLQKRQIDVERLFAKKVPSLQADRQALRQLFLNVLTNAADAMPQGGKLTISVELANNELIVEITDTGNGIDAEDLPKVMDSFFTTKPEGAGTGLGLAICRRIVQEHHGTFDISSQGPGKGTTVHIILPRKNGSNGYHLKNS